MGKKAVKKKSAAKKAASTKSPTKKSSAKKPAARSAKKTAKSPGKKTPSVRSSASKATGGKKPAKPAAKPASKAAPKKASAGAKSAGGGRAAGKKPRVTPKSSEQNTSTKATTSAVAANKKSKAGAAMPEPQGANKSGRKGITIVTPKPTSKPKAAPTRAAVPALTGSILGMGLGSGKPLIPSGPKATPIGGADGAEGDGDGKKPKSPFTKKQLERYREVLLQKRRELLGDIDSMESEALKSQSGSLSHLPQHMAEQGSETYEQSLSLDLAAADRVLLREIEAALVRIRERTYGLCERTGKPISKDRLSELPWARYSIEAAREMERRKTGP